MDAAEMKLAPSESVLLVVDVQEKLAAAVPEAQRERTVRSIAALVEGARLLGVPVIVTEQYPRGLGPTVAALKEALARVEPKPPVIEKIDFDACGAAGLGEALASAGSRRSVVVTGMEAHICVYQTARSLLRQGRTVHVPMDAVCSRSAENARIAESLYAAGGAVVTCSETVLFDWLGRASGETFKAISRLVR